MNQVALAHLLDASNPRASHATDVAELREASLHSLAPLPLKTTSSRPSHTATIGEHRLLPLRWLPLPPASVCRLAFRDVRAHSEVLTVRKSLGLVIPLIRHRIADLGVRSGAPQIDPCLVDRVGD